MDKRYTSFKTHTTSPSLIPGGKDEYIHSPFPSDMVGASRTIEQIQHALLIHLFVIPGFSHISLELLIHYSKIRIIIVWLELDLYEVRSSECTAI